MANKPRSEENSKAFKDGKAHPSVEAARGRYCAGEASENHGAYQKKSGKLGVKGSSAVMSMKPLVDTGSLKRGIRYQITDGGAGVEVGTNRFAGEWEGGAAVHQFGTNRAGKNHNITIPACPFLGLSKGDKTMVLDILNHFIEEAAEMRQA